MTMVDPATVVSRLRVLDATFSSLGANLRAAAATGEFDQVLASASAAIAGAEEALGLAGSRAGAAAGDVAVPTAGSTSWPGGAAPSGAAVVADAQRYLGVPYHWGGTDPATGLDCSGFVQRVYGDLGIALPRTSQEQATVGTPVPDLASAQPGDLLFFEPGPGGPGHVGIYLGGGMMIDAPHTGASVQVEPVWGTPCAIRRVVGSTELAGAAPGAGSGLAVAGVPAAGTLDALPASLGVPSWLVPILQGAATRYQVPAALLAAVAKHESAYEPGAVSSAGAEGLMQLMPATAASLGVDPFDPAQAVDGAARLLSSYLQRYGGSIPLALAAYDAGPGAVAEYGGIPPYAETQAYVASVTQMLGGAP